MNVINIYEKFTIPLVDSFFPLVKFYTYILNT